MVKVPPEKITKSDNGIVTGAADAVPATASVQNEQRDGKQVKTGLAVHPAHRLDRETSGLLACGRRPPATRALQLAFARGRMTKSYLALVRGAPAADRFAVDAALRLTGASGVKVRMHACGAGLPARTDFEVLERRWAPQGAPVALLVCTPHTGRQHQIRAHLHHAGLHVVGDKIYGGDEMIFDRFTRDELTDADRSALFLPRQALHACRLTGRCRAAA